MERLLGLARAPVTNFQLLPSRAEARGLSGHLAARLYVLPFPICEAPDLWGSLGSVGAPRICSADRICGTGSFWIPRSPRLPDPDLAEELSAPSLCVE